MENNKNIVRVVAVSDTHGLHHELKEFGNLPYGDILIHAGDVSNIGRLWEIENFINWFGSQPHESKVFIAGNHDFGFQNERHSCMQIIQEKKDMGWNIHYLENQGKEIDGLKFWGSPITPPFMNWAFMGRDELRAQLWEEIPKDTDILITHGPPRDILDFTEYGNEHCGCSYLKSKLLEIKPILSIHGHIHHSYGTHEENSIMFVNASTLNETSTLNERYQVTNKPIVIDVNIENRTARLVN